MLESDGADDDGVALRGRFILGMLAV